MKEKLFSLIKILIMILFIVGVTFFAAIMASKEKRNYLAPIGRTIVINSDTLIIVNYEGGGFGKPSGYRLSNGVLVNKKIINSYGIH